MLWVTSFFAGWVLFMGIRGYLKGLWASLFDLCGLIAAYIACFVFGQAAVVKLQTLGVAAHFALMGGYGGLFMVVSLFVSLVPRLILAKSLEAQGKLHWQGAGLGAFMGVVSGLVFVWCFTFISGVVFTDEDDVNIAAEEVKTTDTVIVDAANKVMGSAAELGARVTGASDEEVGLLGALAKAPADFAKGMQSVSRSPELKTFMNDSQVQTLMATDNVDALVANYRFQSLMQQPGMQRLRNLVKENDVEELEAKAQPGESKKVLLDRYLAAQLSNLWRRMAVLKNDPRVEKILKDEKVQDLIADKNPAALLANPKVQQLVKIVMEDNPDFENVDFTQFVNQSAAASQELETTYVAEPELPPVEIYRWTDASGSTQYSEKADIPEDRLHTAQQFK